MPTSSVIPNFLTRLLRKKKARPIRNARPFGKGVELLEDRLVPAYLFVDFGDNFTGGALNTTEGQMRDVFNAFNAGDRILGPQLPDASGYVPATALRIVRNNYSAADRAAMLANDLRALLPLNITLVELTSTPQTTADGRTVSGARNMTDVTNTLRGGANGSKDSYVFVGVFIADPGGTNQVIYDGTQFGGTSPVNGLDTSDLNTGSNLHDDVAVVCDSSGRYNFNTMNAIVHEAGHGFGLQHAITNDSGLPAVNLAHSSEIMSYEGTNSTSSIMFSRYPMIRGDGNSPPPPPFPIPASLVNYNDIEARGGARTPFDQLANDPNVGANPLYTFVSGTGANDTITITKTGATATVTVQAVGNPVGTPPVTSTVIVPGDLSGGTTYTYTIPLTKTILVYAGDSDDRIIVDGDLGVSVIIDGMLGNDSVRVNGKGAALATYVPNTTTTTSVDNRNYNGTSPVTSFGGVITVGATTITFSDFEVAGKVEIDNVGTALLPGSVNAVDTLTATLSAAATRITGTLNGQTFIPLYATNTNLLLDTKDGPDSLTLDYSNGLFNVPVTWSAGGTNLGTLTISGESASTENFSITGPTTGTIGVDTSLINYSGVKQITDTGNSINKVFTYTTANSTVTLGAAVGSPGFNTVTSNTGTPITFKNPTGTIEVDADVGTDVLVINPRDAAFTGSLRLSTIGSASSAIFETSLANLVVNNQTIDVGSGTLTLAADVTAGLVGDNGVGTLSITGATTIAGANIVLRGADINVANTVSVGTLGTTSSVTVQSSLATRPMSIGGPNNAAVAGVNLTSAELLRIITAATGTVTFGDPTQTADITFSGATTVNTIGASTAVVQSPAGPGRIVLDPTNGTALNGNGGRVSLTPGTGGVSATLSPTVPLIVTKGFTATGLTLNFVLPFVPTPGQKVTLINDTTTPITGAFTNVAPGARVIINNSGTLYPFVASYTGGLGRDLTLSYVDATTTTVTPSVGTSTYGQRVTLTVTVSAPTAAGAPTGNVELFDDTTLTDLGPATLVSSTGTTSVWTYLTRPTQLAVTLTPAHSIRAAFTASGGFSDSAGTTGVTVTPLALTVSGIVASNKPLDGNTSAPLNFAGAGLVGVVGTDAVFLNTSGAVGTFATKNIGPNSVTVSGLTLTGAAAGNYTVVQPTLSARVIEPVPTRFASGSTDGTFSVFDHGQPLALNIVPFANYRGAIGTAVGDVNGDGVADIAVVKSSAGPAEVKVYNGVNGDVILDVVAFSGYQGGVSIALGDLDGNGHSRIILGAQTGISGVGILDATTGAVLGVFEAYKGFAVGVNVAAGDVDGIGRDRIVTSPNAFGALVKVFDTAGSELRQFLAFFPAIAGIGATVGVGDLNGDGFAEILVAARASNSDYGLIFSGNGVGGAVQPLVLPPSLAGSRTATNPILGTADVNGDGIPELLVSIGTTRGTLIGPSPSPLGAAKLDPLFLN